MTSNTKPGQEPNKSKQSAPSISETVGRTDNTEVNCRSQILQVNRLLVPWPLLLQEFEAVWYILAIMEWFEDEDFWRELYPYMFPPERFQAAAKEVECLLQLAQVTGGGVLDLCCGPGRHSVEFAKRGFHVTGVDTSDYLLERARERAEEFKVQVEWVKDDMRHFRRHAAFQLACILFTSFGYFEDDDENLQVARTVHESLRPGGVLITDVIGKERLARNWRDSLSSEFPDGTLLVQLPQVSRAWSRIASKWLLIKDGKCRTFHFQHTIFSARELQDLMLRAGFETVDVFGNLQGAPYGLDAERLIAVARKAR